MRKKGSLSDEDLEILEYAKNQKVDILVIANKIDKAWEERREILDKVKKDLKLREIEIDDKNVCYFSNDGDYKAEVEFELVHIIQEFIKNVAESKKQNYKLIEMNPEYWNNKGIALGELKRYEEAIECFDKAIELNPNDPWYWYNKGVALSELKRYEEEIECYDRAIELDPNNPWYWNNKGTALGKLERYEEEIECYDRAIELNPNNPIYWNNKGNALYYLKRYEEAIECYDRAIELNPNSPIYWNNKAVVLEELGRYEEAKKCYQKVRELGYKFGYK